MPENKSYVQYANSDYFITNYMANSLNSIDFTTIN